MLLLIGSLHFTFLQTNATLYHVEDLVAINGELKGDLNEAEYTISQNVDLDDKTHS